MIIYSHSVTNQIENLIKIQLEISISDKGIPTFDVYGLISKTIEESKKRIINCFESLNLSFPLKHISINFAPAEISKEGTHYDLAIAVGLLRYVSGFEYNQIEDCFLGEVSFNGDLRRLNNSFYLCVIARKLGFKRVFIPFENLQEVTHIKEIEIIGVKNVGDLLINSVYRSDPIKMEISNIDLAPNNFNQIIGNEQGKRILALGLAGSHHIIFEGFPGAGKSLLAKSSIELLPKLSEQKALEKAALYSYLGSRVRSEDFYNPPLRSPHPSSSYSAVFGSSGKNIVPGEVALSNNGILFLDEFPEFNRLVIEGLRAPLEDKKVEISRAKLKKSFPANFVLIATKNPCKCGYFGHNKIACNCSPYEVKKYQSRISGPIMDRVDIQTKIVSKIDMKQVSEVNNYSIDNFVKLKQKIKNTKENLEEIKMSNKSDEIADNSKSNNYILSFLDTKSTEIVGIVQEKYSLSNRKLFKILNLALTISIFDEKQKISSENIFEALSISGVVDMR